VRFTRRRGVEGHAGGARAVRGDRRPAVVVFAKSPLTEMAETDAAEPVGLVTVTVLRRTSWQTVATEPKSARPAGPVTPGGRVRREGPAAVCCQLHCVGVMPELPPPSVMVKLPPSQL